MSCKMILVGVLVSSRLCLGHSLMLRVTRVSRSFAPKAGMCKYLLCLVGAGAHLHLQSQNNLNTYVTQRYHPQRVPCLAAGDWCVASMSLEVISPC